MSISEDLHDKLVNEEDARLCDDIDEAACSRSPRSFGLILVSYLFSKLGDAIASPKTTLAWACTVVGAPAFVLGFLVPLRESGSMLPQLFIGGMIRRLQRRKWVWVIGSVGQCLAILGIGWTVWALEGAGAGWAILAFVAAFSLARGFCSVAAKDVLGKTVPKSRRGQLNGWSGSGAGMISVGVGAILIVTSGATEDARWLALVLVGAGLLWLVAAAVYAQIPELRGETAGGRNILESLGNLRLLVTDRPFRRFVVTRALLMCSALSAPFYVALAQQHFGSPAELLGAFVVASGLASLVSGPVWGRFSDVSSKRVMVVAAAITASVGLVTFAVDRMLPSLATTAWFLPLAYFVLSVAHSGVRVGRKTYVVNLASGNQRTDYVAIGNSVMGVLLLLVGSVGLLAPLISNAGVIGILALMGLAGAGLATTLKSV